MVNKKSIFLLLIFPVLFFILSNIFTDAYTPYYLNYHHDPSYAYLLNSLNLASGHLTGHVEHPGTPLHIIGAVVIKFYHLFNGINIDITEDVLSRPEEYLRAVNLCVLIINSFVLFFLGYGIYKIYRNVYSAIFMQLCPFFSINIFKQFSDVNAESLIAVPVMLMIVYSYRYINLDSADRNKDLKYLIILSVITGLGIAVKLNFFPLILIPLLLFKKFTQKILILLTSGISFLIFILPGIINYKYFFEWIGLLFFKSGMYGGGESNILDPSKFISNLKIIILSDKLYALLSVLIFIFLILYFFKNRNSALEGKTLFENSGKYFRFLTGIFLSIVVGTVIVSKHYVSRYMMPYLLLIIPAVFLMIYISYKSGYFNNKKIFSNINYVFIPLIIFIIALNFRQYKYTYEDSFNLKNYSMEIHKVMKKYEGQTLISGHLCINEKTALHFGTAYTGRMNPIYKNKLAELFPDQIIYKGPTGELYNLARDTNLTDIFIQEKGIIFFENKYNSVDSLMSKLIRDYEFLNAGVRERIYNPQFESKNEERLYELHFFREPVGEK